MTYQFKKNLLIGLGLAALAKSRLEDILVKTAKRGKLSRQDAEKAANEFLKGLSGRKTRANVNYEVAVARFLDKLGIPTKKEIGVLTRKIDQISREVKKISATGRQNG